MATRVGPIVLVLLVAAPASAQTLRAGLEAPGTSGGVYALVAHDDGLGRVLYAGGEFAAAGTNVAAHVARWRGGTWTALGGAQRAAVGDGRDLKPGRALDDPREAKKKPASWARARGRGEQR